MGAALARKARTGEMTAANASDAIQAFRADWDGHGRTLYRLLAAGPVATGRAMVLVVSRKKGLTTTLSTQ